MRHNGGLYARDGNEALKRKLDSKDETYPDLAPFQGTPVNASEPGVVKNIICACQEIA
jgi:hypothetical protein